MPENPSSPAGEFFGIVPIDRTLWRKLADATSVHEFCQSWLTLQVGMIDRVIGGVVTLLEDGKEPMPPIAPWPDDYDPGRLTQIALKARKQRKGVIVRTEAAEFTKLQVVQLAYPVLLGDEVYGVAALEIESRDKPALERAMRQLQWGSAWLQTWAMRVSAQSKPKSGASVATALDVTALALEEPRFQAAATASVTELATRIGCDRVSIGFVVRDQVRVRALSHSAQFGRQMNLIRAIAAAMGESVDQRTILVYPDRDESGHHVLSAHEQLARSHDSNAICSVPFVDRDGSAFGVLTFERGAAEPFTQRTVELCDSVAALLDPILDEKRKNDRSLAAKAAESAAIQVKQLFGAGHFAQKLISSLAVIVVLFFAFATGEYRVGSKATLEGEVRRVVSAPFRGFILEAPVRGGDIVREGQLMCQLDVRDLRLEYSRWSSEREQYALEHRRAMADRDRAMMNVLSKKIRQAEAQVELLEKQISRASITAPFDGLVVSGDLSQALGAPVDTGTVLFEVAPLDSYRVKLQVDEKDIGRIEEGQRGRLQLAAMPGAELWFTVSKIVPVSVSEEGGNYFAVEAVLDESSDRLRPGMEGFGKIQIERRRLIWIWTHEMADWVRLKAWKWLP